jgi:hypothetical protein
MTFDISGSSDTKCVALSGLRYALGNRSGALRHPAGVVRTLRAQDEKRRLNTNRKLIVHVRRFNRSRKAHNRQHRDSYVGQILAASSCSVWLTRTKMRPVETNRQCIRIGDQPPQPSVSVQRTIDPSEYRPVVFRQAIPLRHYGACATSL